MSVSIDIMQSKPGIYVVNGRLGTFFVEVDAGGIVHQLKPETFERDGELRPGGWNVRLIEGIYGPLARAGA